jgi:L-seryl-tRNA(Ser) seleniumtransferase
MAGKLNTRRLSLALMDGNSKVGGGAMPLFAMPTRLLCIRPGEISATRIEEALREYDPPIIARVEKDQVLLDFRTIQEAELKVVAAAVRSIAES